MGDAVLEMFTDPFVLYTARSPSPYIRVVSSSQVATPSLAREALWSRSGHWQRYRSNIWGVRRVSQDSGLCTTEVKNQARELPEEREEQDRVVKEVVGEDDDSVKRK